MSEVNKNDKNTTPVDKANIKTPNRPPKKGHQASRKTGVDRRARAKHQNFEENSVKKADDKKAEAKRVSNTI